MLYYNTFTPPQGGVLLEVHIQKEHLSDYPNLITDLQRWSQNRDVTDVWVEQGVIFIYTNSPTQALLYDIHTENASSPLAAYTFKQRHFQVKEPCLVIQCEKTYDDVDGIVFELQPQSNMSMEDTSLPYMLYEQMNQYDIQPVFNENEYMTITYDEMVTLMQAPIYGIRFRNVPFNMLEHTTPVLHNEPHFRCDAYIENMEDATHNEVVTLSFSTTESLLAHLQQALEIRNIHATVTIDYTRTPYSKQNEWFVDLTTYNRTQQFRVTFHDVTAVLPNFFFAPLQSPHTNFGFTTQPSPYA